MASPAYEQLLRIQGLDLDLRRLRHRHLHHPIRQDLADVDAEIASIEGELADVESRHHDIERGRKRLEDEAATIAAKRASIDGKLYGGEVNASKELLALQDEAAMLLAKQNELEDEQLELMETLEGIDGERSALADRRAGAAGRRADLDDSLQAALAEIDTEVSNIVAERSEAASQVDATLLAGYESLSDQYDGVAVARLVNGSCDGCHIRLSAVAYDQMAKMPEDAVVTCEECGRLLVR